MGRCGIAAKITGVRGNSGLSFSALVLTNSINQGIGSFEKTDAGKRLRGGGVGDGRG